MRISRCSTLVLAALTLAAGGARAQSPAAAGLAELYRNHDCFAAREALRDAPRADAPELAFYRGWVAAAFNHPAEADAELERFLASPSAASDAEHRHAARQLLADALVRRFRYGAAGDAYALAAETAPDSLREDLANSALIFRALRDVPPQTVTLAGDVDVPITRDRANLINVPVQAGDSAERFVFDTGANLSTVVESVARALGFRVLDPVVKVGTATGQKTDAHLGVAPELRIGTATVRNAVFLVLPDSALSFPQIGYAIHGVVGQPVIAALGEVTLTRDGRLRVPARPSAAASGAEPNLCLDGLDNLVRVSIGGTPLLFGLDTGARTTQLFPPFYERNRAAVDSGEVRTTQIGGAGGARSLRVYGIGPLALTIGGATATLARLWVSTEPTADRTRYAFGDIGQDVIASFAEMTLDYRAMQLRFR
jgi:hypothetical protein